MTSILRVLTILLLILNCSNFSISQEVGFLTEKQAKEEVEIVVEKIKTMHPNPYWYNNEAVWYQYIEKLRSRKGTISIGRQYFDLAYLFSLTSDTHTQLYPDLETPGFNKVYPIRFRTFSDGLYVISAGPVYEDIIGKRVVSFGEFSSDKVLDLISNYVSADHPIRKRTLAEFLLVMPEMYKAFGISNPSGKVKMVTEDLNGRIETFFLDQLEGKSFAKVFYEEPISFGIHMPDHWKSIYEVYNIKRPLTRQHLRNNYWKTEISASKERKAVYIQINGNSDNKEGESQFDFILSSFQEIRASEHPIDRIIIDLRYDLGGWIKNTAALAGLLYGADYYSAGKTVVLIGRESVSAGTILAADIEMKNYAYFIGEPSGSKPNMFLNHVQIELPYSKFFAECATETYVATTIQDSRRYIAPDLKVVESFKDFISGKDVVLEKALSISSEEIAGYNDGYYRGELWKRYSQKEAIK